MIGYKKLAIAAMLVAFAGAWGCRFGGRSSGGDGPIRRGG
jgi:hypothetical protein